MQDVVNLKAARSVSLSAAWERYVEAAKRAQETLNQQDGMAAGAAWRLWLDLFMTAEQRTTLTSARLPSERRR